MTNKGKKEEATKKKEIDVGKLEEAEEEAAASGKAIGMQFFAILMVGLIVGLLIGLGLSTQSPVQTSDTLAGENALTPEAAGQKAINFINNNLIQQGEAVLENIEEKNGLYFINTSYMGNEIPIYVTKDGEVVFVQGGINMEEFAAMKLEAEKQPGQNQEQKAPKEICDEMSKSPTPVLEAYVVSGCPYGLQMQRIFAEIVDKIPKAMENLKIRYMGSVVDGKVTSMHGDSEAQENLRQICLREEQSDKYWNYVGCYMKEGNTAGCLNISEVNTTSLDDCMSDSSKGVVYAEEDFELNKKYEVTGSPTLIMNGGRASEFNFGGRTADAVKSLLCCGFSAEPDFCSDEVSKDSASAGFSKTYSGKSGTGSC